MGIPLYLAVHVVGLTVAVGLALLAWTRRTARLAGWQGLLVGAVALAVGHVAEGLLLVGDLAWPVYLRTAGYAAFAVGAAGVPPTGALVVVALAPPGAHLAAGLAAAAASVATWRGGLLGRGQDVAPLVVGLAAWGAGDALLPGSTTGGGVLALAGSVLIGVWLVRTTDTTLVTRVVAAFVAVIVAVVLAVSAASGAFLTEDLVDGELDRLGVVARARAAELGQQAPLTVRRAVEPYATSTRLAGELGVFAAPGDLDRRAAGLLTLSSAVDVALLVAVDGRIAGTWDGLAVPPGSLPATDAATLAGSSAVAEALAGTVASELVSLGDRGLYAIAATPVSPVDAAGLPQLDAITGAVVLARRLDDDRLTGAVRTDTGADATLVLGGRVAASTLGAAADADVLAALAGDEVPGVVDVDGRPLFLAAAPLVLPGGGGLGALVLASDATTFDGAAEDTTRSLFGVAVLGLLAAAALAGVVARRTAGPVVALTTAAERIAAGDLEHRTTAGAADGPRDEVGRLGVAFDEMASSLRAREASLQEATRVEAALRARLQDVTASMGEGLVATNGAGTIVLANPAACTLLARDDLTGRRLEDVLVGVVEDGGDLVERLVADGDLVAVRGVLDPGGRATPVVVTSAPLRDDGGEVGQVHVLRDISGEVAIERMKTEFLSNISHELRTPLVPVKGYASILEARELDRAKQVEFSGAIIRGVDRLERIIGLLVDYAALEGGRLEVALESTDLTAWMEEVLPGLLPAAEPRAGIPVMRRRIAPDLPLVQVDPELLSRVARELLDNAVKFSDGQVLVTAKVVRVQKGPDDEGTEMVELAVRDRGVGMSAEVQALVTGDFAQADGSATRRHGGLGLGLSIAVRVVERFGGHLAIRSREGEGTIVTVRLQVADA